MKIDLCKIFGVEEGEEFRLENADLDYVNGVKGLKKYKIINNTLKYIYPHFDDYEDTCIEVNEIKNCNIIKLPKKKEFTDDELAIMRSLPKNYKWIARDLGIDSAVTFKEKPTKNGYGNWVSEGDYCILSIFNHLFKSITGEDEEPVFIDDYVER